MTHIKACYVTRENFWSLIEKQKSGCWRFLLTKATDKRLGAYRFDGQKLRLQIIAWKIVHGELPAGQLRRTCENPFCVNPSHYCHVKTSHDAFLSHISVEDGHWLWTVSKDQSGYGHMHTKSGMMRSHRFSYEHYLGKILDGYDVLHRCDIKTCCNPAHLFLGKDIDNVLDREIKGRIIHKMNPMSVKEFRDKRARGQSVRSLCGEYGINKQSAYKILNRVSWRWVE